MMDEQDKTQEQDSITLTDATGIPEVVFNRAAEEIVDMHKAYDDQIIEILAATGRVIQGNPESQRMFVMGWLLGASVAEVGLFDTAKHTEAKNGTKNRE